MQLEKYKMRNGLILKFLIGNMLLFVFGIAEAQNTLNITFRPGANFPVKNLDNSKLSAGGGFETTIAYLFAQHFEGYAGWSWNTFSEKESSGDLKLKFEETGYTFGIQFIHSLSQESKLNFMIGGGGIYNHIETGNKIGDIINDTGHGLGWQIETGLLIPVGHHNRWQLIPSVRYRSLSRDISFDGNSTTVDLVYFSAGLGVSWIILKVE
jgi:hypothetical protein